MNFLNENMDNITIRNLSNILNENIFDGHTIQLNEIQYNALYCPGRMILVIPINRFLRMCEQVYVRRNWRLIHPLYFDLSDIRDYERFVNFIKNLDIIRFVYNNVYYFQFLTTLESLINENEKLQELNILR